MKKGLPPENYLKGADMAIHQDSRGKLGYKIIRVRVADLDSLFPTIPTTRPEDRYRGW